MSIRTLSLLTGALALTALPVLGQDPAQRQQGVRLGLMYQPGIKPGVVVLPIRGGDSVHAIVQRDLDYSDRVEIIGREGTATFDVAQATAGGALNYGLWKTLGAAAVVQATMTASGVRVALHDVGASRVLQVRDFSLPPSSGSPEWRLAAHGISDEIERWITGRRGVAQTRILFVRGGRVYVLDSDGAGERPVTGAGTALSPAWHPSGRYFAYAVFGNRGTQIAIRDVVTQQTRVVTATPPGLNITPEFSPNGNMLVYAHGQENGADLVLTDPFGNAPARRITVARGTDNVSPSFSPDGRRIAFTSGRSGHPEVYLIDVDGSNVELLTPFNFGDQNYRSNPAWSPDGRLIAFQSQIAGRFQIMTISLRDRSIRQLTSEGINEDPAWAPDSRHLVFTSNRTGTKQLFVLDVESARTRQLTGGGGARLASWSRLLDRTPQ